MLTHTDLDTLTVDSILAAAFDLADEYGLDLLAYAALREIARREDADPARRAMIARIAARPNRA